MSDGGDYQGSVSRSRGSCLRDELIASVKNPELSAYAWREIIGPAIRALYAWLTE